MLHTGPLTMFLQNKVALLLKLDKKSKTILYLKTFLTMFVFDKDQKQPLKQRKEWQMKSIVFQ